MAFLTPEETGGPLVFSLRRKGRYLAAPSWVHWHTRIFDINHLAQAMGQSVDEITWQEHARIIKLACKGGELFVWLDGLDGGE